MPSDVEKERHLVALLREPATEPQQLRTAFLDAGVDVQAAFELLAACVGTEAASRFSGRFLRRQSPAVFISHSKAEDVKRIIDAIRQREGDLRIATLAERLNDMDIPAPRGGAWRGEQVYRVLMRSGEGQRTERKKRPPLEAPPAEQTDKRRRAKRKDRPRPRSG